MLTGTQKMKKSLETKPGPFWCAMLLGEDVIYALVNTKIIKYSLDFQELASIDTLPSPPHCLRYENTYLEKSNTLKYISSTNVYHQLDQSLKQIASTKTSNPPKNI